MEWHYCIESERRICDEMGLTQKIMNENIIDQLSLFIQSADLVQSWEEPSLLSQVDKWFYDHIHNIWLHKRIKSQKQNTHTRPTHISKLKYLKSSSYASTNNSSHQWFTVVKHRILEEKQLINKKTKGLILAPIYRHNV